MGQQRVRTKELGTKELGTHVPLWTCEKERERTTQNFPEPTVHVKAVPCSD